MTHKVVVIGAGVVGLTAALYLLEKGHDVTMVAKNIPGDIDIEYTSIFAGANWMSFAQDDEIFYQELDRPGYGYFMNLARNEPQSGVHIIPHHCYFRKSQLVNGKVPYAWYVKESFVENVRYLEKSELPSNEDEDDEFVAGVSFDTVTISTNIYLHYLLQKIYALGGTLKRKTIKHIDDAYDLHHSGEKAEIVVNCSGLLSRFLGGVKDEKSYPIRGQILLIRNSAKKQLFLTTPGFKDESLYIFPRKEGGSIVGGTFIPNQWSGVVDPELAKRMIARAKKYLPELVDPKLGNDPEIDVYRYTVGLRPGREGGPRIERVGSIIHNYGIAGSGYQASIGLSQLVVRFAEEFFNRSKL